MVSPEYKLHIECAFDAFSKTTMRFEARTCRKVIVRKQAREISFEYLLEETSFEASSLDDYFVIEPTSDSYTQFYVRGQAVLIESEQLASALVKLPEWKRDMILLMFFLGVKEKEIAVMYGLQRSTINYHKSRSLKLLRQEMERIEHETV